MGKLLEAFKILCSDFDHILGKGGNLFKGEMFQGRILIKEIRYLLGGAFSNYVDKTSLVGMWYWKYQRKVDRCVNFFLILSSSFQGQWSI